jgi:hypothetical protein
LKILEWVVRDPASAPMGGFASRRCAAVAQDSPVFVQLLCITKLLRLQSMSRGDFDLVGPSCLGPSTKAPASAHRNSECSGKWSLTMSNRQSAMIKTEFEPVAGPARRKPGWWIVGIAVIYPAAVIAIELTARLCASVLFDPMPTLAHVLLVSFVPASNLMTFRHLRRDAPRPSAWFALANGAAIAIAGLYALLFVPVLPLAVLVIPYGIGLLPFAPLACLVGALRLCAAFPAQPTVRRLRRPVLAGVACGIALLLALDVPSVATRLGVQWAASGEPAQRARGLSLLRTIGDDDLLLRLCYDAVGRPTGLLSAFVMFGNGIWLAPAQRQIVLSPTEAREIYYRVHGVPFNARPAPFEHGKWSRFAEFQFDNDHGGTEVGGRLKGLDLVSSRIDGSASGDDAVGYLEWTMAFRNSAPIAREVRLELALPPGGVVSRATLWINGEEREAAYGGRGEVRAAYQQVAVQQRRDPLLVTTKGADRVLAQAFPVPGNGGTIQFKIGITAPLEITEPSKARLTLPAIVDRNFSFAPNSSHGVWIESKQALATSAPGLSIGRIDARLFRVAGSIGDGDLSGTRQVITVERDAGSSRVVARLGEREPIMQEVVPEGRPATASLMLVVDGSARLAGRTGGLIAALDAIASATRVGAIIASEPMQRIAPAPWSDAQKKAVAGLIRATAFYGGQDNAPALADALQMLEAEPNATLLWIHGPQPVSFHDSAARLEQATARLSRPPNVVVYDVEPGPNEVLPDAPWAWGARSLPQTGALRSDLADFFGRESGQTPGLAIRRTETATADGFAKGSDHVARLWARDRVLELMRIDPAANRAAAVALAAAYQLVTPVSGAVVLESQQQFEASRLTPANPVSVPTVPEPQQWALALIACAALAWLMVRHRRRLAAAL